MSEPIRTRQNPLFIETLEEAVEATAYACGGKKAFACDLRPDLKEDPDAARKWLLAALDSQRREVFQAVHLIRGLKAGRRHGCHILKHWLDDEAGYEHSEIAPEKTAEQQLAERKLRHAEEGKRLADEEAMLQRHREMKAVK